MSMIDFVSLVEGDLHQRARRVGSGYFFKCPFHSRGTEKHGSLKVSNGDAAHNPGFYCFSCSEHGGAVGYFLKRGYSLEDARRTVGKPAQPYTAGPPAEAYDPPDNPPGPAWQKRAREFVEYASKQFDTCAQTRGSETDFEITDPGSGDNRIKRMLPAEWWERRGLSVATAQAWRIGYNPRDLELPRSQFGLPNEPGKTKVRIPQGFVIPCFVGPDIWYVKIRATRGENKYLQITGSHKAVHMADEMARFQTVIFTEGELDALLTWQELNGLAGVASLGAAGNSKGFNVATWGLYLLYPNFRFAAYDLDAAGEKGAADLERFGFQRLTVPRVRPFDKDLTDYQMSTGLLRQWLISELRKFPGAIAEDPSEFAW